jgi:hypothetical protein
MTSRFVNNWKPKLACLLVAIAVWYLFKENIRRHDQGPTVSDPGVLNASVSASTADYGIPGVTSALAVFGGHAPIVWIVSESPQNSLVRLRWMDIGAFRTPVADFPAHLCS